MASPAFGPFRHSGVSTHPVALVNGASRGIGRGIALELAEMATHDLVSNYAANEQAARECREDCLARGAAGNIRVEIAQADISAAADRAGMLEPLPRIAGTIASPKLGLP